MGSIDPPQGRPAPPVKRYGISGIGAVSIMFGVLLFGLGALLGFALPNRKRTCPACKLPVPAGATVCGHCRADLA